MTEINNIDQYTLSSKSNLDDALLAIDNNKKGFVFITDENYFLIGVITDGDVRRWLSNNVNLNLALHKVNVKDIMNINFDKIYKNSSQNISSLKKPLPVLNSKNQIESIVLESNSEIKINDFVISESSECFIIAEIGNNHNGDINNAKNLVKAAKNSGANCVKFQLRDLKSLYRESKFDNDLGAEYVIDLLEKFQLPNDELLQVFDYCKEINIIPLCTPFDLISLKFLEEYGMQAYKISSSDITNHEFLLEVCKTKKPIICSTGMATENEIIQAVNILKKHAISFVLLHCNSSYPVPYKDINLSYLDKLKLISEHNIIGYSGHERGFHIALGAVALGCKVIEKHLTSDKKLEGNDHKVSLLPDEFKKMTDFIHDLEISMGSKNVRKLTQGEVLNREALGKSLMASKNLSKGIVISEDDVVIKSPGRGLPPYEKNNLIGRKLKRSIKKHDFFYFSDLNNQKTESNKNFNFKTPFGLPVRYHDFFDLVEKTNLDLVEFHFSYNDLKINPKDFFKGKVYDFSYVVHCPELFENDHIIDLTSFDKDHTERSISEVQRLIDYTLSLKPYFTQNLKPKVIVNVGGFSDENFLSVDDIKKEYIILEKSLSKLNLEEIEFLPQTMPPFPWHFGGQRFHNIFLDQNEIAKFCSKNNLKICLDLSHSKLYCNYKSIPFDEFLIKISEFVSHIHIVDAKGIDDEGLQIGEGDIDFFEASEIIKNFMPNSSFIPEIWQGHKNNYAGFWTALTKLEKFLN